MILAGLIIKRNQVLTDQEIIELLRLTGKIDSTHHQLSFDDLTADEFNGLGIITFSNQVQFIVHRNLGYTCSFEGTTLYGLDLRLQGLSESGEILCFLSNPYAATFAYAYFKNGSRKANQAIAGGEVLEGQTSLELGEVNLSEKGILGLVEKIGEFDFIDLIQFPRAQIHAFNVHACRQRTNNR